MPICKEISSDISSYTSAHARQSNHEFFLPASLFAVIAFGVISLAFTTVASAQEQPKPQSQSGTSADQNPTAQPTVVLPKKSLLFPDIASSTKRLSTGQKFELFAENSVSVNTFATAVLGSAITQALNSPTGFGQGWDAYAERFGTSMARQSSSEFFGTFLLASALHQDPRFYPESNPSFGHAMKYSVQRIFITRNDEGRDVANWSGLGGPLMGEGLANVYWPDRNRTAGDTLLRYGVDLAARAGGNMLREYWPVVRRKMRHEPPTPSGHN